MPIVDKINALTGKTAETIEDAIANIDIGGGGGGTVNVRTILLSTVKGTVSEISGAPAVMYYGGGGYTGGGSTSLHDIIGDAEIIGITAVPDVLEGSPNARPAIGASFFTTTHTLPDYPSGYTCDIALLPKEYRLNSTGGTLNAIFNSSTGLKGGDRVNVYVTILEKE